jgi:hypothetical protein
VFVVLDLARRRSWYVIADAIYGHELLSAHGASG